jgi:hypothetical protein
MADGRRVGGQAALDRLAAQQFADNRFDFR